MSVDSVLDEALTILLAKAQRPFPDQNAAALSSKGATLNYQFGDGVTPIVLANEGPKKLSVPYPAQLVWARLCAGDSLGQPAAVSATVDVQMTSFETFGASVPLYATGTIPTLNFIGKQDCDLTNWQTNLALGDWLIARLLSFSGTATWLALELLIRPNSEAIGVQGVADANGDQIVDEDGNVIVLRS